MKDSQRSSAATRTPRKYIKVNNERFSTAIAAKAGLA